MKARCAKIDVDIDSKNKRAKATSSIAKVQKIKSSRNPPSNMQLPREDNRKESVGQEHEEMKMYLDKLQELVPFTPKNKTLSKLEVITSAIFYIRDLRETLGLPPCQNTTTAEDFNVDLEQPQAIIQETQSSSSIIPPIDLIPTDSALPAIDNPTSYSPLPMPPVVSRSPIAVNASLSSSPLSPENCLQHHIKRQPLCAIPSPNNSTPQSHRISQKS